MHKLKIIFITGALALAALACSLTEQTQTGGAVVAANSGITATAPQTATSPATMKPATTATISPACVIRTGVTGGRVNLRSCAGTGCAVVAVLNDGDSLAVITPGDWPQVRTGDNQTGYVNQKFIACDGQ